MANTMKLEAYKKILETMTLDEKAKLMNALADADKLLRERCEANGGNWLLGMVYDDVLSGIYIASSYACEAWFKQYKREQGL